MVVWKDKISSDKLIEYIINKIILEETVTARALKIWDNSYMDYCITAVTFKL